MEMEMVTIPAEAYDITCTSNIVPVRSVFLSYWQDTSFALNQKRIIGKEWVTNLLEARGINLVSR